MAITMRSLVAGLALFLALAPLSNASAAIPPMRFSIRPDPHGSLSEGGDYFVIDAKPGTVVRDALQLSNAGKQPVRVRLEPVDATSAQLGGVDYSSVGDAPERTGSWIDLARTVVTIPAGAVELVQFDVSVPEDARPGVNLGGIAAWTPPTGAGEREDEGLDAAVNVQTRRVVAVQVNLPGPAAPVLEISEVNAIGRPDGIYLQMTIKNEGHGFATGEGVLRLGEGDDAIVESFALDKVVPETVVWYPVRWRAEAPPDGAYPATVEIDYEAGVARWQGDVTVGELVRESLDDRGIGSEPQFPVALVAVIVGAAAAMGAAVWRWKRRRRKKAEAPAPRPAAHLAPPPPPPVATTKTSPPPPPPPPFPREPLTGPIGR